jgi:hypothetical protein
MPANPDYVDLFRAFNAADARYLVVGGYAVIFHTEPRYTKDIDIWVEPTAENAPRVYRALAEFGAPLEGLSTRDLTDPLLVYQIGIEPNRVDVIMGVPGLDFEPAYLRAVRTTYGGEAIRIVSLADLITAKRAAGRLQDLLDVERLTEKQKG